MKLPRIVWISGGLVLIFAAIYANGPSSEEASRNLASIRPNFIVKDLQTSIAYYRERLGFQLDFQGPDDGPFWAGVSRDGIGIMLKAVAPEVLPCPNHTRHEWAPPDANIYSMDPDALFDEFSRRVCPCLLSAPPRVGYGEASQDGADARLDAGTRAPHL